MRVFSDPVVNEEVQCSSDTVQDAQKQWAYPDNP
jgi:hypothetical protein